MKTVKTTALCAGLVWPGIALADRIDGEWCAPDGQARVSIAGRTIVLPPGVEVEGSYTRHEFLYTVPEGSPAAGTEIYLRQLGDDDVDVYRGKAPPERWHRCAAVVS